MDPKKQKSKTLFNGFCKCQRSRLQAGKHPRGSLTTICRSRESTKNLINCIQKLELQTFLLSSDLLTNKSYLESTTRLTSKAINLRPSYAGKPEQPQAGTGHYIAKLQQRNMETYRSKNFQIYDSSFDQSIDVQFHTLWESKSNWIMLSIKLEWRQILNYPLPRKGFSPELIYSKKLRRLSRSKSSTTTTRMISVDLATRWSIRLEMLPGSISQLEVCKVISKY